MDMPRPSPRRIAVGFAVLWVLTVGVLRIAIVPPETCSTPDADGLDAAIAAARDWLIVNQASDGRWLYEYDAETDTAVDDYNLVRHAGVMLSLTQLAADGDRSGLVAAEAGLAHLTDEFLVDTGTGVAIGEPGRRVDAGTAGLLAAALTFWRDATGDTSRDQLILGLGNFLAGQVTDEGRVRARWDPATGLSVPGEYSQYYTGEAWWALVRIHERFPDEGFDAPAWRIADHVTLERDAEERFFPPLDDHWAAYALGDMADWGLADHHIAYAARLLALWSPEVRFDAQRTGEGINFIMRGPTNRGAQHGTNLEGMTSIAQLAAADERLGQVRSRLHDRVGCAAGMLVARQYTARDALDHPAPDRLIGGWFFGDVTRMDFQQHALAGLLGAASVLETDRPEPGQARGPAMAIVGAAVIWLLVARTDDDPIGSAWFAAAGAALVATALAAPTLLDALDVSATSFRLAAAAVVVAGAAAMVAVDPAHRRPTAWRLVEPWPVVLVGWIAADLGRPLALGAIVVALVAIVALKPARLQRWDRVAIALGFAALLSVTGVVGL